MKKMSMNSRTGSFVTGFGACFGRVSIALLTKFLDESRNMFYVIMMGDHVVGYENFFYLQDINDEVFSLSD